MTKQRERYTERARPHRKGSGGGPIPGDGWRNPAVVIALGGLLVTVVLAFAFLIGSQSASRTASAPSPAPEATMAFTPTLVVPTIAISDTEGVDEPKEEGETTVGKPSFSEPENQYLDAEEAAYFATIETSRGPIVVELWPALAPNHVNSFVFLARQGFFDGLKFHRVVPGFVIQSGDPEGTGSGGPGYAIDGEFNADNPVPHRMGTFAMARTNDPDSAGSQFYIVIEDSESATDLNGKYTVFGHVVSGMSIVPSVEQGDLINEIKIEEKPVSESIVSPDDIREGNLPDND